MNVLDRALNKIDRKTLDEMGADETIILNERYELKSYPYKTCFVIVDTDDSVNDEIFSVQYEDEHDKKNKNIVFTDFYGYDEIEESLT